MSVRTYIAIKYMHGYMVNEKTPSTSFAEMARKAYAMADAMIEEEKL